MTIQELVDAAVTRDPSLVITAFDRWDYVSGKPPARTVEVEVWSTKRDYSSGSREKIALVMYDKVPDWVYEVVPGSTTLYWQAAPLKDALREWVSEELRKGADRRHGGARCLRADCCGSRP